MDTLAVADRLRNLNLPARLVWGTADRFQKIEVGERLARDLHAPRRRIEGAKHFTPEDHPEAVAAEINPLLDEVRNALRRVRRLALPFRLPGGGERRLDCRQEPILIERLLDEWASSASCLADRRPMLSLRFLSVGERANPTIICRKGDVKHLHDSAGRPSLARSPRTTTAWMPLIAITQESNMPVPMLRSSFLVAAALESTPTRPPRIGRPTTR